jgi:hypothetical protein
MAALSEGSAENGPLCDGFADIGRLSAMSPDITKMSAYRLAHRYRRRHRNTRDERIREPADSADVDKTSQTLGI